MIPSCTYISQEGLYARIMHKACKPVLAYRYGCSCIHRGYNLSLPHLRLREIAAVSDVRIMLVDGAQEQQVRGVVSSQETRWRSHHASRVAGLQPTICDDVKICTAPPTQKSRAKIVNNNFQVWYGSIMVLVFITHAVTCYSNGVCEGVFILPDGCMDPRVFLELLYFTGDTRVI